MLRAGTGPDAIGGRIVFPPVDFHIAGLELAAPPGIAHPALAAFEANGRLIRDHLHGDAVGVGVVDLVGLGHGVDRVGRDHAMAGDFHRCGQFGEVTDLGRVDEVRAPVSQGAAGEIADLAPDLRIGDLRRVVAFGGGPQPHVKIETRRRWRGRFVRVDRFCGETNLNVFEFSDGAVAHGLRHHVVVHDGTILESGAEDRARAFHAIGQTAAFVDGQGGFFTKDHFARIEGHFGHRHMPMIGRGDRDRIEIIARQEVAKIGDGRAVRITVAGIDVFAPDLAAIEKSVTYRQDPAVGLGQEGSEIDATPVNADSDETHRDLIGRSICAENPGR